METSRLHELGVDKNRDFVSFQGNPLTYAEVRSLECSFARKARRGELVFTRRGCLGVLGQLTLTDRSCDVTVPEQLPSHSPEHAVPLHVVMEQGRQRV